MLACVCLYVYARKKDVKEFRLFLKFSALSKKISLSYVSSSVHLVEKKKE